MTTTSATRSRLRRRGVVFDGISWRDYERIGRVFRDRPVRVNYDRGRLEILTLSAKHESFKHLLGQLIVLLALECGVSFRGFGSMTFKRRLKRRGLEPDECYWIQNESAVRETDRIDLETMPPPDLVLEIEISRAALPRLSIYADLGVPEVWRFDGEKLSVLQLDGNRYVEQTRSRAFPFLDPSCLVDFWNRRHQGEAVVLREFQAWVRNQIRLGWPNGGAH